MHIYDSFFILFAKIILSVIMLAVGFVCLIVIRRSSEWEELLREMEIEADIARDSARMHVIVARSQLAQIHLRLTSKEEKAEVQVIGNILKQAMPLVTLFMAKETSLIKWGFAGLKLVRSASEYFGNKKQD